MCKKLEQVETGIVGRAPQCQTLKLWAKGRIEMSVDTNFVFDTNLLDTVILLDTIK